MSFLTILFNSFLRRDFKGIGTFHGGMITGFASSFSVMLYLHGKHPNSPKQPEYLLINSWYDVSISPTYGFLRYILKIIKLFNHQNPLNKI